MKRISALFITILALGAFSCQNDDWEFSDFDYTSVYFPYQYPVRTLVLGDYVFDNENDNNMRFTIAARVGGMYENHSNWSVQFRVADELAEDLEDANGNTIMALPSAYYTLNPASELVIPKGQFDGRIEVQLTEDFFEDPLAVGKIRAGQQNLRNRMSVPGERFVVALHQQRLPNGSRSLLLMQQLRPFGVADFTKPGGHSAGGDQQRLVSGLNQPGQFGCVIRHSLPV